MLEDENWENLKNVSGIADNVFEGIGLKGFINIRWELPC